MVSGNYVLHRKKRRSRARQAADLRDYLGRSRHDLDISIVIAGLPKAQASPGFMATLLAWMQNAYTLAAVCFLSHLAIVVSSGGIRIVKCLIAYYSRQGQNYVSGNIVDLAVGNTEIAASIINCLVDADLAFIDTITPYPVDYSETTDCARRELRGRARPELKDLPASVDDYDVVFLGFPNWWGTPPMAVFTFLETFDFTGKTILPFCTHEGSGMGRGERDIRSACPGATVLDGLAIRGGAVQGAEGDIRRWIQASGIEGLCRADR